MTQLLQNAAYGTALILAVILLRRVLKDRLFPGARLALWAVCLFRLLTPAAPESVLSLWGLSRLFAAEQAPAAPPAAYLPGDYFVPAAGTPAPAAPAPSLAISWETVLLGLWLAVGAVLAARYALSWKRTRRAVSCAIPLDRGDERYALLPKFARLREGPMEGAPLTFGAVRPTVVLSPGLEGEALDCVLAHEGVHAQRRDNLWHYAMALALVVHWWNPAVWLMSRLLRRDIELSCDRAAVRKLGENRRAEYAQALVSLATQADGPAFCHTFGRKAAEERILSIMKFKKTSVIGVIFSLALVLAVTMAFASEPKTVQNDLPEDVLQYAESLYLGMPRADVHQLLGKPSFSLSSPHYSDSYELDPDSHERQLGIYYDVDSTVTQVKYFPDGTDPDGTGIDLAPYLSSSASAFRIISVPDIEATKEIQSDYPEVDPDDVDLSKIKELLAKKVADGVITQEEADQRLADTADLLEQARRGEVKLFMATDRNGEESLYGSGVSRMYYRDENGDLIPMDPTRTTSTYVLDGYVVETPVFDMDGNSVSVDGGIIGTRFGDYDMVVDGSHVSGSLIWTPNGTYELCKDKACDVAYDHCHIGGKVVRVYQKDPGLLCARPDCGNDKPHQHDGVQYAGKAPEAYVVLQPDTAPVPSAAPAPTPAVQPAASDSDLIPAMGTNGKEGYIRMSDTLTGQYERQYGAVTNPDEAMKYMEWLRTQPDSYTIPLYDAAGKVIGEFPMGSGASSSAPTTAPSTSCGVAGCTETRYHAHNEGHTILLSEPCPVEGCTITGNHIHGDVCYSCNGTGHDGGVCDGSCYTYNTSADTHHSESHHSGSHH